MSASTAMAHLNHKTPERLNKGPVSIYFAIKNNL